MSVGQHQHSMRLVCLSTASLLAVAFPAFKNIECAHPDPDYSCARDVYLGYCGSGNLEYLRWAATNCESLPQQECIDAAFEKGNTQAVGVLHSESRTGLRPSMDALNRAAGKGILVPLVYCDFMLQIRPNETGRYLAEAAGNKDVVAWMDFKPPTVGDPHAAIARFLASNGHAEALQSIGAKLHSQHGPALFKFLAIHAVRNGHLNVLQWINSLYPQSIGTCIADNAACCGKMDIVRWMHTSFGVRPDQNSIDEAAKKGALDVLRWMASLEPGQQLYPTLESVIIGVEQGHDDMGEWWLETQKRLGNSELNYLQGSGPSDLVKLANVAVKRGKTSLLRILSHNFQTYPDENSIDQARKAGHMEAIEWIERNQPKHRKLNYKLVSDDSDSVEAANRAAGQGNRAELTRLAAKGFRPDTRGVQLALQRGDPDLINWIFDNAQ